MTADEKLEATARRLGAALPKNIGLAQAIESIETDLTYAKRQLRDYACYDRAKDALVRAGYAVAELLEEIYREGR